MNTVSWILQGVLCFVFFMAGAMKLAQTRKKVIASGGKWAEDFTGPTIKLIGAGEVLIAVGLVVPKLLGLEMGATLVSFAALGAMVIMGGAFFTHLRRKETPFLAVTGVIFALGA